MIRWACALAAALLVLTGCAATDRPDEPDEVPAAAVEPDEGAEADEAPEASDGHAHDHSDDHAAKPVKARPLRPGESRATVRMPASYTPSAPYGAGTDDYRCFLLDPGLDRDAWLTGTHVVSGNAEVVHHVILFRVPPAQLAAAKAKDAEDEEQGWTCFGGTGLDDVQQIDDAPWLGAWAPGGEESVTKPGFGVRLEADTRIVMQVHYNLLAGQEPDASAAQLRLAPGDRDLQALSTTLLPAPVELPCRAAYDDGPLCERAASIADVQERFGVEARTADLLHFLCGTQPRPGPVQSCTRTLPEAVTIHGVAAHMHLLGRQMQIEVNPGTPEARTILDIGVWDFDDQGSRPIEPVTLDAFDRVKVTCRHTQSLRDRLPAFEGQPDRYVVWGEGTTDEMCLGMLQVTRP